MSTRELTLGPSLRLVFEDRQSRPDRKRQASCDCLIASLWFQGSEPSDWTAPSYLADLAHRVYAEVEGNGRSFASPEAGPGPEADVPTSPGHVLCFEFNTAQIEALRAGADFGFGIDDDRMRVGAMVKRELRASLLADLD